MIDERRVRALLDPIDRLTVKARHIPQSLLCELLALAFGSDVVPDGSTAVKYPVGQGIAWHAYTLVGASSVVCTTVGTFMGLKHPFE